MDSKEKITIAYEAIIDAFLVGIIGMYIILSQIAKNILFVGFLGTLNVFIFSYFMRKFIRTRELSDLTLAVMVGIFPFILITYILFFVLKL